MSDNVDYQDVVDSFDGQTIERDGVQVTIENVTTAAYDPHDGQPRFSFDIKAEEVDHE